eukprot:TRINITY_DN9965_c0_g1_i1.p2 TRINITY_DN9965_c0_g1~~TRINITY_DN9965_c0_g1_i1.p2  ORF type:complete len:104 (+),score=25.69 TRINITY_DN9965_c0_g1_i1:219-530(+)
MCPLVLAAQLVSAGEIDDWSVADDDTPGRMAAMFQLCPLLDSLRKGATSDGDGDDHTAVGDELPEHEEEEEEDEESDFDIEANIPARSRDMGPHAVCPRWTTV